MQRIFILGFALLTIACKQDPESKPITKVDDYNAYLSTLDRSSYEEAQSLVEFWSKRLRPDSSGVGELGPLAAAYEQLFEQTGNPKYLKDAEALYSKGADISAHNKDGYLRSLAHNFISQHRFKEAYDTLTHLLSEPTNKHETNLILFDAAMEVGKYEKAYEYLGAVKNIKDYHYLIRLSKWSDYRGDLDSAITYMEQAMAIAESRDSRALKIWTYSNLGDYYGHAGRIAESYEYYLKTLSLQPDNSYVKKGIAWIVYSEEKNTKEAIRILDSAMKHHSIPDYHLLKSELYEFEGDIAQAELQKKHFLRSVESGAYGDMYNGYLIELYGDTKPQLALEIAKKEVESRATPETYHLLALAQMQAGMPGEALKTIQDHVVGKTFEPIALYHTAQVYKANKMEKEILPIKEELLEANFELGPLLTQKIKAL
ncbi:MAG: tetratricopeptide repeat protein [Bacteroidota bacterium]